MSGRIAMKRGWWGWESGRHEALGPTYSGFIKSVAASVSEWRSFPLAHARSYVRVSGHS